jgi:hypothetical protein
MLTQSFRRSESGRSQHRRSTGKLADLVVLEDNPPADIANLSHATAVFKNGHECTPAELMSTVH